MSMHLVRLITWVALSAASISPLVARGQHPLDPLSDVEIVQAAQILLTGHAAQSGAAFQSIELREPRKETVLNYSGGAIDREALVFVEWRVARRAG
jgi:Cu2+-containing amine oxidase